MDKLMDPESLEVTENMLEEVGSRGLEGKEASGLPSRWRAVPPPNTKGPGLGNHGFQLPKDAK